MVSVIIPTYNYAIYISEAIDSILQQNYPKDNIEIIIVDDGSTDNTSDVLKPFVEKHLVKYYYQPNCGKANATSNGISKSSGKYIFNLDADDLFLPNKILKCVQVYENDDAIAHVASPAKVLDAGSNRDGIEEIPTEILEIKNDGKQLLQYFYDNNILFGGGSTFSARASILKSIVIPGEVNMYIDEFLVIAVLNKGASFFFKEPLSIWRIHANNYSANTISEHTTRKQKELAINSVALLDEVRNGGYSKDFLNAYIIKHETRRLYFLELSNKKKISDIVKYIQILFKHKASINKIKKYSILPRLLPTGIVRFLKSIKK